MVASAEAPTIANMQRGIGGRLEDAFQAAKERGQAAFVTFVTAGYPTAQGVFSVLLYCIGLVDNQK
jgi:tryptophan synthase